jgi:hypothetical protein
MTRLSIQGYSNLVKDPTSGGVVNNDPQAFVDYKKKRKTALQNLNDKKALENRVTNIETDINNLKSDVNEIKNMLNQIIDKLT